MLDQQGFFFDPLTCLLEPYLERASEVISSCNNISAKGRVLEGFHAHLVMQCAIIAQYSLYVDYRTSAKANNALELRLWAKTFEKYGWDRVFSSYPILKPLLLQRAELINQHLETLCTRIDQDSILLKDEIGFNGKITNIEFGLSDPHRGAQTVTKICNFNSAVIYKPKPLCNERLFFDVVQDGFPEKMHYFVIPKIVERGDYGWMEYFKPPSEKVQPPSIDVRSFAAALCYFFSATDLHYQNVGTISGKLFFFDLEALFLPVEKSDDISPLETWRFADILCTDLFRRQLSQDYTDPSGYSSGVVKSPYPKLRFVLDECGALIPSTKQVTDNAILKEEDLDSKKMSERVFADLQSVRNRFPIETIRNRMKTDHMRSRYILRSTENYYRIHQWLYQPTHLTSEKKFSLVRGKIHDILSDRASTSTCPKVAENELAQLIRGDIPVFTHDPTKTDLYGDNGSLSSTFFAQSGEKIVQGKCQLGDTEDLKYQAELVWATNEHQRPNSEMVHPYGKSKMKIGELRSFVREIQNTIGNSGIQTKRHGRFWVGHFSDTSGQQFVPRAYLRDYYSGSLGVTVFLEAVDQVLPNPSKGNGDFHSSDDVEQILRLSSHDAPSLSPTLGLGGVAGELHALGILWLLDSDKWANASDLIAYKLNKISADQLMNAPGDDFIQGAAGLLTVASFLRYHGVCEVKDELLVDSARYVRRSIEEKLQGDRMHGLAHGLSGSILALSQSSLVCDNTERRELTKLVDSFLENIARDISNYGFLTDARVSDRRVKLNRSWCHGTAGISLVLEFLHRFQFFKNLAPEIDSAIIKLLSIDANDVRHDVDNYCCGETGEIDHIITRSRLSGDGSNFKVGWERFANLRNDWKKEGKFRSFLGLSSPGIFPGLFQGAAGIGYTGLRLIKPDMPNLTAVIQDTTPNKANQ